eukprot:8944300-Alexandrium_andersonii.AAC.1
MCRGQQHYPVRILPLRPIHHLCHVSRCKCSSSGWERPKLCPEMSHSGAPGREEYAIQQVDSRVRLCAEQRLFGLTRTAALQRGRGRQS